MEDSTKGNRLLLLDNVKQSRKVFVINLIESELLEMKFEIISNLIEERTIGWHLDIWKAKATRINNSNLLELKHGISDMEIQALEIHTLEEIEIDELKKVIKTSSIAKKFGI